MALTRADHDGRAAQIRRPRISQGFPQGGRHPLTAAASSTSSPRTRRSISPNGGWPTAGRRSAACSRMLAARLKALPTIMLRSTGSSRAPTSSSARGLAMAGTRTAPGGPACPNGGLRAASVTNWGNNVLHLAWVVGLGHRATPNIARRAAHAPPLRQEPDITPFIRFFPPEEIAAIIARIERQVAAGKVVPPTSRRGRYAPTMPNHRATASCEKSAASAAAAGRGASAASARPTRS